MTLKLVYLVPLMLLAPIHVGVPSPQAGGHGTPTITVKRNLFGHLVLKHNVHSLHKNEVVHWVASGNVKFHIALPGKDDLCQENSDGTPANDSSGKSSTCTIGSSKGHHPYVLYDDNPHVTSGPATTSIVAHCDGCYFDASPPP